MNIWELVANEDYNNAYLIDENGNRCNENGKYFREIQIFPQTRNLKIETNHKGFSDIMNYWGVSGSCIVSTRLKALLVREFGNLNIQFIPCISKHFPNVEMWILNVCEYHDVLDLKNSVYQKGYNLKGEEIIKNIERLVFKKEAFKLDMFKIIKNGTKRSIRLYVSDHFKAIMDENGITGLALEKVYSI